jgi:hypothetical protein
VDCEYYMLRGRFFFCANAGRIFQSRGVLIRMRHLDIEVLLDEGSHEIDTFDSSWEAESGKY